MFPGCAQSQTFLIVQPFMEAGLDSLGAVELRNALEARFDVSLPATATLDYPSITAMAAFIASKLAHPTQPSATVFTPMQAHLQPCAITTTCILGSSCRYPASISSMHGFWEAIKTAEDLPYVTPLERWDVEALYEPERAAGKAYARFAAYLDDAGSFDGALFGLAYAEALGMDPQSRLLLEGAHEALRSSPQLLTPDFSSTAGTYVGCMYQEYADVLAQGGGKVTAAAATGNSLSFMVGRCAPDPDAKTSFDCRFIGGIQQALHCFTCGSPAFIQNQLTIQVAQGLPGCF